MINMCGSEFHNYTGFCDYCYSMIAFNRTSPPRSETTLVRYLILADNIYDACRLAQKKKMNVLEWVWIISAETLTKFPEAIVYCVEEELHRADLQQISEMLYKMRKEVIYEDPATH